MNLYNEASICLASFLLCLLFSLLAIGSLAVYQQAALLSELQAASFTLHREASQRADQHDAHLTLSTSLNPKRERLMFRRMTFSSKWRQRSLVSIRASMKFNCADEPG